MKKSTPIVALILFTFLFSCHDDLDQLPELAPEPIAFERIQPNLVGYRGNVGNLAVYHDRLYYSNIQNPGYFTANGEHIQFGMNIYNMDMGQAIDGDFLIGPLRDLKSLVFNSTQNVNHNYTTRFNITSIPGVPQDAILSLGNMFKLNFGLNGNHFLFNYQSSEGTNALIVELNISETPSLGKILVHPFEQPQVLNVVPIKIEVEGTHNHIDVGRVFPYKEGWVASTNMSGLAVPLLISKDGSAKIIPNGHNVREKRINFISLDHSPSGELFATSETDFFYSRTGNVEDLTPIAQSNQWMRIRFVDDRLVCFIGRDIIFEIINYKDSETIGLRQLENHGLDDLLIRDIAYFHGKVYVATNAGLFTKTLEDFWAEKTLPADQQMDFPLERIK